MPMHMHGILPLASVYQDARYITFNRVEGDQINIFNPSPALTASSSREAYIAALNPVDRIPYYQSVPKCFGGSRQWIFDKIHTWLDDYDEETPNVLWLSGGEGAGKSAIASTLVSNLQEAGRLGGYWFSSRDDTLLSDPAAIWRTIASDLAHMHPEVARRIARNIRQHKVEPLRADIELHFKLLVEDPSKKCWEEKWKTYMASPKENEAIGRRCPAMGDHFSVSTSQEDLIMRFPVIVIDALDECGKDPSQSAQRRVFLDTIARWATLRPCLKLLVTSREQPTAVNPSFRDACRHIDLKIGFGLQNIEPNIDRDIQKFFQCCFLKIGNAQQPPLYTPWPGSLVVKWLTCCAGGSFGWADMFVRYLELGIPTLKLDMVVNGSLHGKGEDVEAIKKVIAIIPFLSWKSWIMSTSAENLHASSSIHSKDETIEKRKIFSRKWWHRQKENNKERKSEEDAKNTMSRRNSRSSVTNDRKAVTSSSTVGGLAELIASLSMDIPEDEQLVLNICDRATADEQNAKEAVEALQRKFLSAAPFSQLYATRLWALMLWKASEPFIRETASPSFLHALEMVLTSPQTNGTVREHLMDVLSAVTYASRHSAVGGGFRDLWLKVKPSHKPNKGAPLSDDDPRFRIQLPPSCGSPLSQGKSALHVRNTRSGSVTSPIGASTPPQ
ncbi:hypothetical protein FIBSPDRAFT_815355 [Athelia psychrophila]|uniref:VHS domain-containing protein n=1 Tax=Athelia psychrophila TaxID=1759441 RepID=A0A166T2Y2_9AGAM|nr:hypothetical protein FIBSPDRAFT_815355 [Fibularhizoctonia sp. CBS 109695]